jgi:hypothetical protein
VKSEPMETAANNSDAAPHSEEATPHICPRTFSHPVSQLRLGTYLGGDKREMV